jgi:hypothetical protein
MILGRVAMADLILARRFAAGRQRGGFVVPKQTYGTNPILIARSEFSVD